MYIHTLSWIPNNVHTIDNSYFNGFLALVVLVFAFTRLPLFDNVVQTEWFNNLATTYSATGLSLEDLVLFVLLVLTSTKQYLQGNLPYLLLYPKLRYRYLNEYQECSFRKRLFVGWYLYAIEKKLVKIGFGRVSCTMIDAQFVVRDETTVSVDKFRAVLSKPMYLLWFSGQVGITRSLKRRLRFAESEAKPDSITYKNVEPFLYLVLATFEVSFGVSLLRSLWRYSLSANTDLEVYSAQVIYFYTIHQKIEVSREQYLLVIADFCQYLNKQQTEGLIRIRDSIDDTLDNCHKLAILERRFFGN